MLRRKAALRIIIFHLFSLSSFLWGQTSFCEEEQILARAGFYENAEVRIGMKEAVNAPFFSLLARQKEVHEQILSPVAVEFELRKSAESFYLLFKNEQNYRYPVWGRGNFIIKRDLKTGAFLQIKIFLQNDEGSYIRLFPLEDGRSVLDLMLYGVQLYSDIVIPVSLEDLAVSPFSRLMYLTRGTVRWDLLLTDRSYAEWEILSSFVDTIREELDTLYEAVDGAQNRNGEFVHIEDGSLQQERYGVNCSGFAKWVADGMLMGQGGRESLISIEDLKIASVGEEERLGNPWNTTHQDRDPYFGLDWTRNLARILKQAQGAAEMPTPRGMDVCSMPFFNYKENIGYNLENLRAVLYLLAIENPGAFYMGAVNSLFGEDPVLWQYHHIVLFFPWFTSGGDFRLAVLETGRESSLENLMIRYPDSFVHLVKVEGADDFISPGSTLETGHGAVDSGE